MINVNLVTWPLFIVVFMLFLSKSIAIYTFKYVYLIFNSVLELYMLLCKCIIL